MRDLLEHIKVEASPEAVRHFQKTYLEGLKLRFHSAAPASSPACRSCSTRFTSIPKFTRPSSPAISAKARGLSFPSRSLEIFRVRAYADDSSNRNELGPFALRRAKEVLGIDFPPTASTSSAIPRMTWPAARYLARKPLPWPPAISRWSSFGPVIPPTFSPISPIPPPFCGFLSARHEPKNPAIAPRE